MAKKRRKGLAPLPTEAECLLMLVELEAEIIQFGCPANRWADPLYQDNGHAQAYLITRNAEWALAAKEEETL
jgi:hypothetical protein